MALTPRPPAWEALQIAGHSSWEDESDFFRDVLEITRPESILETGCYAGASTFMLLQLSGRAKVTSVDPMDLNPGFEGHPWVVDKLKGHFGDRFTFLKKDSRDVRGDLAGQRFDLFYVDGDHTETGIRNDFQLALDLEIPWLFVDDLVTEVAKVYVTEFQQHYDLFRLYPRKHQFQGRSIPMGLMRRKARYHTTAST